MNDEAGERIREARTAKGISQADLAAAVGVSNSYLSHIEAGRRPVSEPIRQNIATALGIDSKQLEDGVASDRKEEFRLKLSFAEMALRNGDWELSEASFAEALENARAMPLARFVDQANWGRARALEAIGRLEDAIEEYEGLLKRPKLSAAVSRVSVCVALVRAYRECGDLSRAIDIGEAALSDLEGAPPTGEVGPGVELLSTLAGCYVERGDLTRATLLSRQALAFAEQSGSMAARAAAAWEAAVIADSRHDGVEAQKHAARALALYEELDSQRAVGLLRVVAAGLLLRQERPEPDRALPLLARAELELSQAGNDVDLAYVRTEQARAQLLAGEAELAAGTAAAALEALAEGDRLQRGRMLLVLGHAARAQGRPDDALASFESAANYLRQAGAVRQAATAWRELGEAYADLGRPSDALDALRQASDLVGVGYTPQSLAAVGETVRG